MARTPLRGIRRSKKSPAREAVPSIGVSEFKARCLELLEETRQLGKEWIITKRAEPLARVTPMGMRRGSRRGSLKGLGSIEGDIVHWSSAAEWEAET
ncbi:MAG: type II toxin-antitoxin system prevent-host-death family antitoxin [Deltaproteobacteria bacterium]|nr:type II toxin-antitoxin system prevent-host-death family antitoxin [Deltaproteobacteria bacterium]